MSQRAALLPALLLLSLAAEPAAAFVAGDVDADGRVTLLDVARVRDHVAGRSPLGGAALAAADADLDGTVTAADRDRALAYALGDAAPPVVSGDTPRIAALVSPPPNSAGWNREDVTVAFTCWPATLACPPARTVAHDTAAEVVSGSVTDGLSRTATVQVTIKRDATPPTLTAATTPAPNANGWNSTAVTVTFAASDAMSGLASTPAAVPVSAESADNIVEARAVDRAGNETVVRQVVRIDRTPPVISAFVDPAADADGVHRTRPVVTFVATDGLSGVAHVTQPVTVRSNGASTVAGTAGDRAGNVASTSARVDVQRPPSGPVPRLVIAVPQDGQVLTSATTSVSGTVHDIVVGSVGPPDVDVTVNGVPAAVAQSSFQIGSLALQPGPNVITAVARDPDGNETVESITVTRDASARPRLEKFSGDTQTATVGGLAARPLIVRAVDAAGVAQPGVVVTFRVARGDGTLGAAGARSLDVVTDALGRAQATFRLGRRAGGGSNRVEASAADGRPPVMFTTLALPGPASAISWVAGDGQRAAVGDYLAHPIVVQVTDAANNPIGGVTVTFEVIDGGGSIDGASAVTRTTDTDGRAQVSWRIGDSTAPDGNLLAASHPAMTGPPAVFRATGVVLGDPAATRITGVVLDNQDLPVPGTTMRVDGTALETTTDAEGRFALYGIPTGHLHLIADARTTSRPGSWPELGFELDALPGINNALDRPIYVLPMDEGSAQLASDTRDVVVTSSRIEGLSMRVLAGSAGYPPGVTPGPVTITPVNANRIPMPPEGRSQPNLVITVQPGGATLDPPAPITFPNADGLPPGAITELWSFDHDLGAYVSVGPATVAEDGADITTDPGFGVIKMGWHFAAPDPDEGDVSTLGVALSRPPSRMCEGETIELCATAWPRVGRNLEFSWSVSSDDVIQILPAGGRACRGARPANCCVDVKAIGEGVATLSVTVTDLHPTDPFEPATDSVEVVVGPDVRVVVRPGEGHAASADEALAGIGAAVSYRAPATQCEWAPVQARVNWSIVSGQGGAVAPASSIAPPSSGATATRLTTTREAGASYVVRADVPEIVLNGAWTPPPVATAGTSAPVTVVAGAPASIDIEPADSEIYGADARSSRRFDVTVRDAHANLVGLDQVRSVSLEGGGLLGDPFPVGDDASFGIAVVAPRQAGTQALVVEAGGGSLSEPIPVGAIAGVAFLESGSGTLDACGTIATRTADLAARFVGPDGEPLPDGTPVQWFATAGRLVDRDTGETAFTSTMRNGLARIRLDAEGARLGTARVRAAVGNTVSNVQFLTIDTSATFTVRMDEPVLVGSVTGSAFLAGTELDASGQPVTIFRPAPTVSRVTVLDRSALPSSRLRITLGGTGASLLQARELGTRRDLDPDGDGVFETTAVGRQASFTLESRGTMAPEPGAVVVTIDVEAAGTPGGFRAQATGGGAMPEGEVIVVHGRFWRHLRSAAEGFFIGDAEGTAGYAGDLIAGMFLWGDVRDIAVELARAIPGGDEPNWAKFSFAVVGMAMEVIPAVGEAVDFVITNLKILAGKLVQGPLLEFVKRVAATIVDAYRTSGIPGLTSRIAEITKYVIELAVKSKDELLGISRMAPEGKADEFFDASMAARRNTGDFDLSSHQTRMTNDPELGPTPKARKQACDHFTRVLAGLDAELAEAITKSPRAVEGLTRLAASGMPADSLYLERFLSSTRGVWPRGTKEEKVLALELIASLRGTAMPIPGLSGVIGRGARENNTGPLLELLAASRISAAGTPIVSLGRRGVGSDLPGDVDVETALEFIEVKKSASKALDALGVDPAATLRAWQEGAKSAGKQAYVVELPPLEADKLRDRLPADLHALVRDIHFPF